MSSTKWERKRAMTIQELEAALDEDSDLEGFTEIDAVYIPPAVDSLTDEENLDEDHLVGEAIATDIVGTFEIHTDALDDEGDNFNEPTPGPSSSKMTKKIRKCKPKQYVPSWIKQEPSYSSVPNTSEFRKREVIIQNISGKSPLEIFLLFFDDTVLNAIVNYSLKYAQDNNRHDFKFSARQLKQFLGILILTGYHTLPACDMYWSKDEDKCVDLVRKCMSRNTFRSVKRNIHLSDNSNLDKADKFSKLRPVFNLLNEKYLQFGIFTHNLSIDEQMVPYFGRHSAKMFMKGKPVRFGFKIWCLCSSGGYLYQFIPYGGASKDVQQEYSLGTRVVIDLLSVVSDSSQHKVFFDNFFSSYNLFHILREKGFFFTGTVRENRLPNCPIQSSKILGKQKRGEFDFCFDESAQVTVTIWNDSSVVTVATNYGTIEPILKAKRYNRKLKKEEQVAQPNVINDYNLHMGGVDLLDNAVSNYRIKVRGKKWWWPLFINLVDCTISNAWKIYNIANDSHMSQLEFRSFLVMSLIRSETKSTLPEEMEQQSEEEQPAGPSTSWGRPSRGSLPSAVRFDDVGHIVIREEEGKRRRCRVCKTHTIYLCNKCKVHLHSACFKAFHTKSS